MGKREWRNIREDNERHVYRHAGEWWRECARVDVEALRREIRDDGFAKRRMVRLMYFGGRTLEGWERQVLKELIAKEQLRRYKKWQRMELTWKRRGVTF